MGGFISYLGYFTPVPISTSGLHWCALELIATSYVVWTFVIAHGAMALVHTAAARTHLAGRLRNHLTCGEGNNG